MGKGVRIYVTKYDLSSLKLLGTVGEPINLEAWNWYNEMSGKGKCPIVDTWWQTRDGRPHDDAASRAHMSSSPVPRKKPLLRGENRWFSAPPPAR